MEKSEPATSIPRERIPRMLTIRQTAATGILPEHALRMMAKAGQLPAISVGDSRKILINFDALLAQVNALGGDANG